MSQRLCLNFKQCVRLMIEKEMERVIHLFVLKKHMYEILYVFK